MDPETRDLLQKEMQEQGKVSCSLSVQKLRSLHSSKIQFELEPEQVQERWKQYILKWLKHDLVRHELAQLNLCLTLCSMTGKLEASLACRLQRDWFR